MAISLTTLYNRLGKLMGMAKAQIDARNTLLDRVKGTGSFTSSGLDAQYDASTRYMISQVLDYFLNLNATTDSSVQRVIDSGAKTLIEMIYADNPNIYKAVTPSMVELNRQMRAASQTIYRNVITQGSVSYAAANVGTGKIILHGIPSQMSPSETIRVQCVSDTTTGATLGREVFQITGGTRVTDVTSYDWPGGSGAALTQASSDYNDSQNTLTNGGFDSWTGGVPDGWTVTTGAANIAQLSSGTFRNGSALQITPASNTAISQTTTASVIGPGKRIVFGFWVKKISGTVSQPVYLSLQNANTGLEFTYAQAPAASITTSWQLFTASYQFDYSAPVSDVDCSVSMGLNAGCVVAVDCAFIFVPPQAGTNGQFIQIIGGETDWRIGDYATVTISNNYQSNVLTYTERFFAPFANGIELPTDATGTVTNSVIP